MKLYILLSVSSFLSIFAQRNIKVIVDPKKPAESRKLCSVQRTLVNMSSYAGYFNVDRELDINLFYWFFVTEFDAKNTPLVIWLQGQSGLSSLFGLFEENGPISIDDKLNLKKRKYAWTNKYNVLYLDPHINCGFSYSTRQSGEKSTVKEISWRIWSAIQIFFKIFPEFKSRDLYLAGEFDSSKYITIISHLNLITDSLSKINLKGLLVGGGFAFQNGPPNYEDLFSAVGLISQKERKDLAWELLLARAYLQCAEYNNALVIMNVITRKKVQKIGYDTLFDMRDLNSSNSNLSVLFSKRPSFRHLIHAGDEHFKTRTAIISYQSMESIGDLLNDILTNYKLLLFTGQFDMLAPFMSTSQWISEVSWTGCSLFYNSSRNNWIIDGQLLGYWKHAKNLIHLLIRNAGHMVGRTNPFAMYHLLDYFIENKFD